MFKQGKGFGIGSFVTWLFHIILLCTLAMAAHQSAFASETVTYYHNDALGSPVAASDETGTVTWREEYKPFGERILKEDGGTNDRWYTGKLQEEETGLSYLGARWYDPGIGRFMAMDPEDLDPANFHSFNRYAYANNNPYAYVDPNGQSPLDIGFLLYDIGKLGVALYTGAGVGAALVDVGMSIVGVASPIPGTGQALKAYKLAKVADKVKDTSSAIKNVAKKVDLNLKYKDGWSTAQKAAANTKCQALCDAKTVVTEVQRSGTSASSRYKRAGNSVPSGSDVDHVHDLQLGGSDTLSNMLPLDSSVNRSLGSQIYHQIKNLPPGTVIDKVNIH